MSVGHLSRLRRFQFPIESLMLPASAAVAAKLTEEGGGEGWGTSNGLELSQNWKRFDSSLMLLSQERKAHARNES